VRQAQTSAFAPPALPEYDPFRTTRPAYRTHVDAMVTAYMRRCEAQVRGAVRRSSTRQLLQHAEWLIRRVVLGETYAAMWRSDQHRSRKTEEYIRVAVRRLARHIGLPLHS
jgi:hypothetical protein